MDPILEREVVRAMFTNYVGDRRKEAWILRLPHVELFQDNERLRQLLADVADAVDMDLALLGHVDQTQYTTVAAYKRNPAYALQAGDIIPIGETYCREEITADRPFVLGDATIHERFREHPGFVKHKLRSYVGAPIILPGGVVFGTLCGVDVSPKVPSLAAVERLVALASEVADEINRLLDA